MSHMRKDYGGVALIVGLLVLVLVLLCSITGCAHNPNQSWDQANLKRNDHGCPTAIFVAPRGELVQCQQHFNILQLKPIVAPREYDTAEQAAVAAFKVVALKPSSTFYEWGGKIVQFTNGKYAALNANTSYEGDTVAIQSNSFALNATTIGDYHTHPCIPEHYVEYFSAEDLIGSIFYHHLLFMGDFCTGNVHEFKVGDKPDTEHPRSAVSLYLTKGRIIGQFTTPHAVLVTE